MEKFFNELIDVLEKNQLSNNQISEWKSIEVDHTKIIGDVKEIRKNFKLLLAKKMDVTPKARLGGIYAYFDDEECLYIGKTKDLINRLTTHYIEAQDYTIESDWHTFFRENAKPLKIYFSLIDSPDEDLGEALRIVVERLLLIKVKPKFETIHKSSK